MGWMKVLVVVAVLLGGTLGTAWFLGTRLPAEHRAVASGVVRASPERVWNLVTRTVSQKEWRTGLEGIQNDTPRPANGVRCWTEGWPAIEHIGFCVSEEEPMVRRVVQMDKWSPFHGRLEYDLAPVADGTRVTITEETMVGAPMWRFYGNYVLRGQTQARQYLEDLQAEAVRRR